MTQQYLVRELIAKNAAAAGLSVEAYRQRQLEALRRDLRAAPEDNVCGCCGGRRRIGRFSEMPCPECD